MRSIKLYSGIDYDFRPESYWTPARNLLEAALRNVKGRNRRQIITDYYEAGKLEQLHENLIADTLDEQSRKNLGLIHPTFMGGEYLPNYGRSEVEIARIELQSTTNDVISLRARPVGSRIKYRLIDEYSSQFRLPQQTSSRPFSLGELIGFLDSVEQDEVSEPSWNKFGFVLSSNHCNLGLRWGSGRSPRFHPGRVRFLSGSRLTLRRGDRGMVSGAPRGALGRSVIANYGNRLNVLMAILFPC